MTTSAARAAPTAIGTTELVLVSAEHSATSVMKLELIMLYLPCGDGHLRFLIDTKKNWILLGIIAWLFMLSLGLIIFLNK